MLRHLGYLVGHPLESEEESVPNSCSPTVFQDPEFIGLFILIILNCTLEPCENILEKVISGL